MKASTHSMLWFIGAIGVYILSTWSGPEAVTNRDVAFLVCLILSEIWTGVRYIKDE